MSRKNLIILLLAIFLIGIQWIKPPQNYIPEIPDTDFNKLYQPPTEVKNILQNSCYDCHSNQTRYPWYNHIQPIAFWINLHVKRGKNKLNLSEIGKLNNRKQISKLLDMSDEVREREMPLKSYQLMHSDARLSVADRALLTQWLENKMDSLRPYRFD